MQLQLIGRRIINRYRRLSCSIFVNRQLVISHPQAIVSFAFDDFPRSALKIGGSILQQSGAIGTFYVSFGLSGKIGPVGPYFSEREIPELVNAGHELGCHTYDHMHPWLSTPDEYEQSIIRNRQRLQEVLPGAAFHSHSYPFTYPHPRTKRIVQKYFRCARGGGQELNTSATDINYLDSFFIEKSRDDLAAIKAVIDRAKTSQSWLIFSTHDVTEHPSPFGCTPQCFQSVVQYTIEAGIPVLPVSRAFSLLYSGKDSSNSIS